MAIYLMQKGDPLAPRILFIHGFLGSSQDWQPVVERLIDSYCCLIVDLPGHGRSISLPEAYYTFDGCVDALLANEALKSGTALVGYSMGGRVAMAMAAKEPGRFSGLFIESGGFGNDCPKQRFQRLMQDESVAGELEKGELMAFLDTWYSSELFASLKARSEIFKGVLAKRRNNIPRELAKAVKGLSVCRHGCLRDALKSIEVPFAYVAGELDRKYASEGKAFCSGHNRFFLPVPGVGHNVHEEALQYYIQMLETFLINVPDFKASLAP